MDKATFKKNQPVVYRTLSRALKQARIAHAYMFAGPKSAETKETALLLVQSLFCPHPDEDGFACMTCPSCRRYAARESIDVEWVELDRIKKKDILALQQKFSVTAMEKGGKRVYVLDGFDKATPDASNALLKFLEEPGDDLFGILLVENPGNTLTTIQSRCQLIQFRPGAARYVKEGLLAITSEENAKMLASAGYSLEDAKTWLEQEAFETIHEGAREFLENIHSVVAVYHMQKEVFPAKGTNTTKEWVRLWLLWLLYYIKRADIAPLDFEQKIGVTAILIETLDVLNRPVDLALCLDKVYARVRKVVRK